MNTRWFFISVTLLLFAACEQHESTSTAPKDTQEMPDHEMWNFKVIATSKGKMEAVIQAGHMQRFSQKSVSLFDQGVYIDFYGADGDTASVLTADGGEYDENTSNVKAIGNVVVVSDSGFTLYTEELFYYKESDQILSNVQVKVTTTAGDTLYGVGFESDAQMNSWHIKQLYNGIAHKGVDLSIDRLSRDSTAVVESSDSTFTKKDSTAEQ